MLTGSWALFVIEEEEYECKDLFHAKLHTGCLIKHIHHLVCLFTNIFTPENENSYANFQYRTIPVLI